jgi:hypothetical protein
VVSTVGAAGCWGSSNGLLTGNGFDANGSSPMRGTAVGVGGTDTRAGWGISSLPGLFIVADIPRLLYGREYAEVRSAIGDGGLGKAKDSEGEWPVVAARSSRLFRRSTKRN